MMPKKSHALFSKLKNEQIQTNFLCKVEPVKSAFYKVPNPMEALEEVGQYPVVTEEEYLENKSPQEEEDFYLLRKEFSKFARQHLETNNITSLILGEAYAKKVRYGVTYSSQIEDVISYLVEKLEKELSI